MPPKPNLTYLRLPEPIKRRAQMAAAGLGLTMSEYVASAILRDSISLGVREINADNDDIDQEAGNE